MIGAFGKHSKFHQKYFTLSTPYYQDDFTWCIQRAKLLPLDLNVLQICSIFVWFIIVLHVVVQSIVLNISLQIDRKYDKRNHRDLIYTFLFISMPAVIGVSQRFNPKSCLLRIYYGLNLLCGVIIIAYIITYGYAFLKKSIWSYQVHTIAEIVHNDFRLAGTEAALESMRKQNIVSSLGLIDSSTYPSSSISSRFSVSRAFDRFVFHLQRHRQMLRAFDQRQE